MCVSDFLVGGKDLVMVNLGLREGYKRELFNTISVFVFTYFSEMFLIWKNINFFLNILIHYKAKLYFKKHVTPWFYKSLNNCLKFESLRWSYTNALWSLGLIRLVFSCPAQKGTFALHITRWRLSRRLRFWIREFGW